MKSQRFKAILRVYLGTNWREEVKMLTMLIPVMMLFFGASLAIWQHSAYYRQAYDCNREYYRLRIQLSDKGTIFPDYFAGLEPFNPQERAYFMIKYNLTEEDISTPGGILGINPIVNNTGLRVELDEN